MILKKGGKEEHREKGAKRKENTERGGYTKLLESEKWMTGKKRKL